MAGLGDEGEGSGAYTFPGGIAQVAAAIARRLGGRFRTGARVTSVGGGDEAGYRVTYVDGAGRSHGLGSDAVVIATPAPVTLDITDKVLSGEQKRLLGRIPYASFATAALFTDQPLFDQAFDLALPDGWFFTDLYDANWVQRAHDPAAGGLEGAVASLYIAPDSYRDRSILRMSDSELLARSYADLHKLIPGARDRVKGVDIHRFEYAYPVTTPGAFARLIRLHRTLGGGLQLAGDGLVYPTFEAAVAAGGVAAERVAEFL